LSFQTQEALCNGIKQLFIPDKLNAFYSFTAGVPQRALFFQMFQGDRSPAGPGLPGIPRNPGELVSLKPLPHIAPLREVVILNTYFNQ